MRKGAAAFCLTGLLAASPLSAEISGGAGSAFTAGSSDYSRFVLFGDVNWEGTPGITPYLWSDLSWDSYSRAVSLGGGAWKEFGKDLRVKGGLGLNFGRIRQSEEDSRSAMLEAGVEKFLRRGTLAGAEYRFTSGSIAGPAFFYGANRTPRGQVQGKRGAFVQTESESFTFHELSGYARMPVFGKTLGLRLNVGFPSYEDAFISESVSLKFLLRRSLALTPAFTLEQSPGSHRIYAALSLYYAL